MISGLQIPRSGHPPEDLKVGINIHNMTDTIGVGLFPKTITTSRMT